jgi:hypothetical protein
MKKKEKDVEVVSSMNDRNGEISSRHDKTNRSEIKLLNNDTKIIPEEENEESKKKKLLQEGATQNQMLLKNKQANIIKSKPLYLDVTHTVLQNPTMQMYGKLNYNSVCPFCKHTGPMDIEYERSSFQKRCCIILAVTGLFLVCWIPLIIKALSNQIYKCNNCKRILQSLPASYL